MTLQAPSVGGADAPAEVSVQPAGASADASAHHSEHEVHAGFGGHGGDRRHGYWTLAIGSLGVVFGDIGTSPLYAFQAAMGQAARDPLGDRAAIGVVSLAVWGADPGRDRQIRAVRHARRQQGARAACCR